MGITTEHIETDKKELRRQVKARKAEMPADLRNRLSDEICRLVMQSYAWQQAKVVLLYMSMTDEVNTATLIRQAWNNGKTILLPTCVGDDLVLRVYEGDEHLRVGAYGIVEPTGRIFGEEEYGAISLVVVPGMAFDKNGGRLGRGRGFYDRLLPKLQACRKIGVCWGCQMVDKVPVKENDVRMDEVISI